MYFKLNNFIKNNPFAILCLTFLSVGMFMYLKDILCIISKILVIINPIIIGLVLAFLINVPMKLIENKILDKLHLNKHIKRFLAIIFVFVLFAVFISFFINIIVPDIQNTLNIIQINIPTYIEKINKIYNEFAYQRDLFFLLNFKPSEFIGKINVNTFFDSMLGATTSFIDVLITFALGFVFAFHLLLNKEIVKNYSKRIVKKLVDDTQYKSIRKWYLCIKNTFSRFLIGQITDAMILGVICYIVMSFSKIPYASVICLSIAITALVPIIGAWVGTIIGFLLIVFISPTKAILFIVEFIIIQQIDNHFIYPNIVGKSIGLESVFIIVAIIIGGEIGGALGMLIAIPVISIIIQIIDEWLKK